MVQVGRQGLTDALLAATLEALERHELIKISVARDAPIDRKVAAAKIAEALGAHVAQTIGRMVLLYRRRQENPEVPLPGVVEEAPTP